MSYEVLALATKLGVEYDPTIGHRGRDALDTALASSAGVLVLGVHAKLNYLAVRYLDDRGMAPHVVATYTDRRIFGRRYMPRYIGIDTRTLLDVRQALRQRSVVIALTDRGTSARHATGVDIEGTRIYLSNGLAAMAVATNARIVFMHPMLTGASVEFAWGEPPLDADITAVMKAFGIFLQDQVTRRRAR